MKKTACLLSDSAFSKSGILKAFPLIMVILFLFIPNFAPALDLKVLGGAANTAFDQEREEPIGSERFEPALYPFGLVSIDGDYSDMISYHVAYERDPILRNRVLGNIGLNLSIVHLDFGPFLGIYNTKDKIIDMGLSAGIGIELPGIFYVNLKGASTFISTFTLPGDYLEQNGEVKLGFWVPHVLFTLSANSRSFTELDTEDLLTKDELNRFQFAMDIFSKNIPYTICFNTGFQMLKRSYTPSSGSSATEEFRWAYVGFETTWRVIPELQLIFGATIPVYNWSIDPLRKPANTSVMFETYTGFVWTIPEGKNWK
jgi:hypothetical protein